jgi:hypothetical protein
MEVWNPRRFGKPQRARATSLGGGKSANPELAGRGTVPLDAADAIDERQQSAAPSLTRASSSSGARASGASHSSGARRCLVLVFACFSGMLCSWKKG